MLGLQLCRALLLALPLPSGAPDDGGWQEPVRLQATVVVASNEFREAPRYPSPFEARLRKLLPYTSYRSVTEYNATLQPGQALDLRLPDGRAAQLRPGPQEGPATRMPNGRWMHAVPRAIHVTIEGGENFDSRVLCGEVTVVQVRSMVPGRRRDRTFLVYSETCPGQPPRRLLGPNRPLGPP